MRSGTLRYDGCQWVAVSKSGLFRGHGNDPDEALQDLIDKLSNEVERLAKGMPLIYGSKEHGESLRVMEGPR